MAVKVVILGAAGMLGHKLLQQFRGVFPQTLACMRKTADRAPLNRIGWLQGPDVVGGIDVNNFAALSDYLSRAHPEFVVNCVGVIKQRSQAQDPLASITLNALLPHRLAELVASWNGRLIHFSTDCVFSGTRGGYTEQDESDAHDLYGRSKFLGETAGTNALTLRTSIIGRELTEHRSLLEWLLAQRGPSVRGFRRVIYSGVTTNHLADLVATIIQDHPKLSGLYQVAGRPISKYHLLCLLRDAYGLNVTIEPDDTEQSDRSMSGAKLCRAIGYTAPTWPELIGQLVSDPTPYESWLS